MVLCRGITKQYNDDNDHTDTYKANNMQYTFSLGNVMKGFLTLGNQQPSSRWCDWIMKEHQKLYTGLKMDISESKDVMCTSAIHV